MPPENKNPDPNAPAPNDQNAPDPAAPKFMTPEEFNGAVTARFQRFEKSIAQSITKQLEQFWASKNPPADPNAETVEEGGETTTDPAAQAAPKKLSGPELAAKKAIAKVDQLTKQMAAKDEAAAKEKAELLQRQERSEMYAALSAAGVTTAKGAYATLREDGKIRRNADGELVMVVVKDYAGTKHEEEVSIAEGLKAWLATDEGKCFLPPRGGGEGSGTTIRGGAPRTGGKMTKEEAKAEAQRMLTSFVLGSK